MPEQTHDFDDRVALLEEHIVRKPEPSAAEYLAAAEQCFAEGRPTSAELWLRMARSRRTRDMLREELDELEQALEDDDGEAADDL